MSVTVLQQRIREKKTPLALGLRPEPDKLSPKILKNFTDMFGPGSMAEAEALRYHGTTLLDAAAEKLPAVMLHGASYLRYGMMGADVLANLISAAHAKGLYVILGMGAEEPALWQSYGADAITVAPYMGSDCCDAGEQAVFALVRTCNKSGGEVQNLMAGDRPVSGGGGADGPPRRVSGGGQRVQSGYPGRAPPVSQVLPAAAGVRWRERRPRL